MRVRDTARRGADQFVMGAKFVRMAEREGFGHLTGLRNV